MNALADNVSGTMKWRMSLNAIASISKASAAPNAPRQSGLAAKLKPTASAPINMGSTVLRTGEPASRTQDGSFMQAGEVTSNQVAVKLGAQLLRHHVGVDGIADDGRADEDDQLGAHFGAALLREQVADAGNLVEHRDALPRPIGLVADQAGEQDGLAAGDRNRALDAAVGDRRRQARRRARLDARAFLLDVDNDIAAGADARHHAQDDAGIAIVDGADHRIVRREHGCGAGRDR